MSSFLRWLASVVLLLAAASSVHAAEGESAHIKAKLVASSATVKPGGDIDLALDYTAAPGWHTYWINAGDTGLPPKFTWSLPDGFTQSGEVLFPTPERLPAYDLMSYGYEGRTILLIPMHNASPLGNGQALPIHAKVDFLVCKDVCIPESLEVALRLTVGDGAPGPDAKTIDKARQAVPVDAEKDGAPTGATIDIRDGMVELGFPFGLDYTGEHYFYIEQSNVIVPGAPQTVEIGTGGYTIRTKAVADALPDGEFS
ncbi:MAG: cytochrome C biogenesis protein, partial [Asticcacaulis sp.]|nr:cytochrome C biogenesis protein [Asticcacaulis sp.]